MLVEDFDGIGLGGREVNCFEDLREEGKRASGAESRSASSSTRPSVQNKESTTEEALLLTTLKLPLPSSSPNLKELGPII